MISLRTNAEDRRWKDLVSEIEYQLAIVAGPPDDRIRIVWALKIIAESIAQLDQIDRLQGKLPIMIRPPLMLSHGDACAALQYLKGTGHQSKTHSLVLKFETFLDQNAY